MVVVITPGGSEGGNALDGRPRFGDDGVKTSRGGGTRFDGSDPNVLGAPVLAVAAPTMAAAAPSMDPVGTGAIKGADRVWEVRF